MGTSYDFLPNVVLGTSLGLAEPCMGSTIALSRARCWTRSAASAAFADYLADDYEMGRAVRGEGYALAIPAMGVGHTAAESSAARTVPPRTALDPHHPHWSIRWVIWAASSPLGSRLP